MLKRVVILIFFASVTLQVSCGDESFAGFIENLEEFLTETEEIQEVNVEASDSSQAIYEDANLNHLCLEEECEPDYDPIPDQFKRLAAEGTIDLESCNYDFDHNLTSDFELFNPEEEVAGVDLLLSKEDLFFLAWASIRYKMNPHFLLGVMLQESRGNCAAVSFASGQGCFQITYDFGQPQLETSYGDRVVDWVWTDRSGFFPSSLYVDDLDYFGEEATTSQNRMFIFPDDESIDGVSISSVANFHYGVIASALYFHWQQYLLYYLYEDAQDQATVLFNKPDEKVKWQSAAYNAGAFGASSALENRGNDYLAQLPAETRNYAPNVAAYCQQLQNGEDLYDANYSADDMDYIIDLLAGTYPEDLGVDWEELKSSIRSSFFQNQETINFVKDIKAIIYTISTYSSSLAPEWPAGRSIGVR